MLITQPKAKIFEKIIRNEHGDFIRAYFWVIFHEGQYFAKLVKIEPFSSRNFNEPKPEVISAPSSKHPLKTASYKLKAVPSPYFHLDFLTSVKIRAPSK